MLTENKISKYFLYAIGEIVLVVIGILIAISINNWNENIKEKQQEKVILTTLKKEFSQNKTAFSETIVTRDSLNSIINNILKYTGQKDFSLSKEESGRFVRSLRSVVIANISSSYINELLTSNKIHILQNDSLKTILTNWPNDLIDYHTENAQSMFAYTRNSIRPFLDKNYSFGSQVYSRRLGFEFNSQFSDDYKSIYGMREFENITLSKIEQSRDANQNYHILITKIDNIIEIISQEQLRQQ